MNLDRFRAPALAAAAVLMISGAGIAFARSPASAASTRVVPARVVPAVQTEPTGPDTDTLQQGDQTTPDVVSGVGSAAKPAAAKPAVKATSETASEGTEAVGTEAVGTEAVGTEAEGTEAVGTEAVGTEADGAGGHADLAGKNVDHQFNGQE
jgi:hypothetical protein